MKKYFIAIPFILLFVGCATPQAVKSLSSQQMKVQKALADSLKTYFPLIEKVIKNQIKVFKREEDEALKKQIRIFQAQYKNGTSKQSADKDKLLNELTEKTKKATDENRNTKLKYDQYLTSLKKKHQELITILETMVVAQATLNNYIQLERADEAIAGQIFSALGLDQEKLKSYCNEVNNILQNF